ncbi:bifunctional aspartate kinase/homoserine dehydrogenase II [Aeromonas cavernicola]|uniref:Bifunctional aspartokinase/homoserine dehydrogenase n=1 Tax=Aeromonas cavernicola TaxID=1006623 RepID=A0A2H9U4Y7_9GAMM|nr:bifunctional aspartate kinase/homoserine dehydrogenase II [Aeromonas cavernicola]PJG59038.1 bifunctional aspartate kinase/homoserine dehydrogenase II [Aeromonas cavernicola]
MEQQQGERVVATVTAGKRRHVHKFGGSSLADPVCYRRVAAIVEQQVNGDELVVVSAAGKTTNRLIQLVELAEAGDEAAGEAITALQSYQQSLIDGLLEGPLQHELSQQLADDMQLIAKTLEGHFDRFERNGLLAFGEVWSARLLAALLTSRGDKAIWLDARSFLRAEDGALVKVDTALSSELLKARLAEHLGRIVVTGFIAADMSGRSLLLGRNGSDYSASLLALLADGESTTIWSDVAGVYSADPRRVKEARLLERLSLAEANELARLGSSVLHSRTLQPVADSRQRLTLRCSYNPDEGCTHILRRAPRSGGARIVSSVDHIALIELKVLPQAHYEQAVATIEAHLARHRLNPLTLQRQADRRILRLAYTLEVAEGAFDILRDFQLQGSFTGLIQKEGYSLVALVGAGVTDNAEQCHRFYQLLADQPLEFVHVAKDGLSLVAVLRQVVLEPLLITLHSALFSRPTRVGLVLFGKGNIGGHWLGLYAREKARLEHELNLALTLYGVFSSEGGQLDEEGLDPLKLPDGTLRPLIWPELLTQLEQHSFDTLIALDITASETVSRYYPDFAQLGIHIIAANKFAGAADSEFYQRVKQSCRDHQVQWRYNATVGAGLPVQSSIQMLRQSGDRIKGVSGIFSGTLSWLFQQYDGSRPFSELVDEAWQQGLTEPDPREDLSGQDVRRKLLILAREAGFALDSADITLENLVPAALRNASAEQFMDRLNELDEPILSAFEEARRVGKVLRYVARIEHDGKARVGLEVLEPHHPFANLLPCDNVFAIESDCYRSNPLVIQGPGAGRDVTAAAIQYDLWQICAAL